MQNIIAIENGVPRHPLYRMKEPVNMTLAAGEHIAVVGRNGAGKSILVDTITGRWPLLMNEVKYDFSPSPSKMAYENIKYIAFRDSYGDSDGNYYYQQRWNAHDLDETPLVRDLLPEATDSGLKKALYELFGIERMLDKHIILLSSGELRKFQLTKTLLSNPRVLIMDNPFIGLDAKTRDLLHTLLGELTKVTHLQVILILSKSDDIPAFITHVIPVEDRVCGKKITLQEYLAVRKPIPERILSEEKEARILNLPYGGDLYHTEHVVDLNKVSIRYGERTILKDLDWTVKCGEKWALSGENGSGKSTLAKHINAILYPTEGTVWVDGMDTNDGSKVWNIRQSAGMVFQNPDNQIIGQVVEEDVGFGPENMGVPTKEIWERVEESLKAVGMYEYRKHSPNKLSGGQKQRVSIAGVLAMHPKCIVLDEPTAMLDPRGRKEVIRAVRGLNQVEGITVILITHYMEEIIHADRVFVMDGGKIAMEGTPREIFSQVEKLKSLRLDVPQVTLLAYELQKKGIALPDGILTREELADALCRLTGTADF